MDSIVLCLDLKELLSEITDIKKEYMIKISYDSNIENSDSCSNILNVLFDWIEINKIHHIYFYKINFFPDIWILVSYLIKFSSLHSVTFDCSFCLDFKYRKDFNLKEIILASNLKKITFIDEKFNNDEYIQIYNCIKTNYRLMEISICERYNLIIETTDLRFNDVIKRNQDGWTKIKNAVYSFLIINKFTQNNYIANLPLEIVLMICECIISTRDDHIWYNHNDDSQNKIVTREDIAENYLNQSERQIDYSSLMIIDDVYSNSKPAES